MVRFCEDAAKGALQFQRMAKPDRDKLVFANKELRPAVELIMDTLREIQDDHKKKLAKDSLRDAIFAALLLGRYSGATESAELFAVTKTKSDAAKAPRPEAISPFTKFFDKYFKRNRSGVEIKDALIADARHGTSGDFELSEDGEVIISASDRTHRLKISGISSAISKAKANFQNP